MVFDFEDLKCIVEVCDTMYISQIYKALYLMAFYSFMRISNLASHVADRFSPATHLAKWDLFFRHPGVQVLKWSYIMQCKNKIQLIKIPSLGQAKVCPVAAQLKVLALILGGKKTLLLFKHKYMVNGKTGQETLKMTKLGKDPAKFPLHTFCKPGATMAFNASRMSLQEIKKNFVPGHCVFKYVIDTEQTGMEVASTFKAMQPLTHQVQQVCKSAFHQIFFIYKIRPFITQDAVQTLVQALVVSRLDYGNALRTTKVSHPQATACSKCCCTSCLWYQEV